MAKKKIRGYLLDTSILIELLRQEPRQELSDFISGLEPVFLSVVTVYELANGWHATKGHKLTKHNEKEMEFLGALGMHPLGVDFNTVIEAACITYDAKRQGKTLSFPDAMLAGTAKSHDLCLVTTDTGFEDLDISKAIITLG